jgi:hypothetical protein
MSIFFLIYFYLVLECHKYRHLARGYPLVWTPLFERRKQSRLILRRDEVEWIICGRYSASEIIKLELRRLSSGFIHHGVTVWRALRFLFQQFHCYMSCGLPPHKLTRCVSYHDTYEVLRYLAPLLCTSRYFASVLHMLESPGSSIGPDTNCLLFMLYRWLTSYPTDVTHVKSVCKEVNFFVKKSSNTILTGTEIAQTV